MVYYILGMCTIYYIEIHKKYYSVFKDKKVKKVTTEPGFVNQFKILLS